MLIISIIVLFVIDCVMCYLYELCFDARKLIICNYANFYFFGHSIDSRIVCPRISLLGESQILSMTRESCLHKILFCFGLIMA